MKPLNNATAVDQMGFCMGWLLTATLVFRDIFEPQLWEKEVNELIKRARAIDIRFRTANGMPIPPYY